MNKIIEINDFKISRDNIGYKKIIKEGQGDDINTFDLVEQGDLVCGADEHSADIRVVEGIIKNEGKNNNVLLSNSKKDLFYEGTEGIELFNKEWRLLCKRESLVK